MAGMDRTAGRWAGPVKKAGKSAIRTLLIVAIFVGAGAAVYAERSTIGHGIHNVGSLRWGWVAAASLLSGNPAASVGGLLIAIVMVAGTLVVAVEMRSERGRARLLRFITVALRGMRRITRHPKGEAGVLAQTVLTSIQRMRLG